LKTLALEDTYADPHKLDPYLDSGEPVAVIRAGQAVAEFVPHKDAVKTADIPERPLIDFRERFLKMWGPDAFKSEISVAGHFDETASSEGVVNAFADASFLFAFY
jgi:hypothetical protein